jgi:hypothetical protein
MGLPGGRGRLLRPLIVGAMVACIAVAREDLLLWMGFRLSTASLLLIPMLTALESSGTRRLIRVRSLWQWDAVRTRLIEFGVLFLMVLALSFVGRSWVEVLAELSSWPDDPAAMLGPDVMLGMGIALLSWWATNGTERDVQLIREPPRVGYLGRTLKQRPAQSAVSNRVFGGGVFLLGLTALPDWGAGFAGGLLTERASSAEPYLLAYFLLGMTLTAQVQHTVVEQRWRTHGVRVSSGLAARWVRCSIAILALATVVALALPSDYSVGLFELLARAASPLVIAASYFVYGGVFVALFLLALFGGLVSLLFGDVGSGFEAPEWEPPVLERFGPAPAWLEIVRSVAFWAAVAGAAIYVVRGYLRDHPGALRQLLGTGLLRRLWEALLSLRRQVGRAGASMRRLLSAEGRARGRRPRPRGRFPVLRPGSLPPRERIRYYYANLLRRAARLGLEREGSQTPLEYEEEVEPALPQRGPDLRLLTQAFIEARYSAHPITPEQAKDAAAQLRRLRGALRSAARAGKQSGGG